MTPTPKLNAALAKFQAALPSVAKGETAHAGTYTYSYAGLDDVSAAIEPALGKVGLAFTAFPHLLDGQFVLVYSLLHESGEERIGVWPLGTGTPQQRGSAITYGRRYCLLAVTGVFPGGEDDDGEAAGQAMQQPRVRTAHSDTEHRRLRDPTPDERVNGSGAARTHGPIPPEDDRWAGQPAGDLALPENQQGIMDGRQRARMFALFADIGLAGEDIAQRALLSKILGGEVQSRGALSWADADKAIKALAEHAEAMKLPGSAAPEQVGMIASLYASKLAFKRGEKEQMLAASEQIIGRTLTGPDGERTHKNLAAVEARKLHDTLDGFEDRPALETWLRSPAEVGA